jgi:hypothetical protein
LIGIGLALGAILVGTFLPIYVALLLIHMTGKMRRKPRKDYVGALGLGIALFFFVDITLDSTELGVNSGFSGGLVQGGLLISFVVGALLLISAESFVIKRRQVTPNISGNGILFLIPAFVAISIGIHGTGEGSSFAFIASTTSSTDILTAFGGTYPLISYVIHKFLEAIIVGSAYFVYVISDGGLLSKGPQNVQSYSKIQEILILGFLMGLPSALGVLAGYYAPIDPIYFYAFASGATIYTIAKLAEPSLNRNWNTSEYALSPNRFGTMLIVVIGFILLYVAALFHSVI